MEGQLTGYGQGRCSTILACPGNPVKPACFRLWPWLGFAEMAPLAVYPPSYRVESPSPNDANADLAARHPHRPSLGAAGIAEWVEFAAPRCPLWPGIPFISP